LRLLRRTLGLKIVLEHGSELRPVQVRRDVAVEAEADRPAFLAHHDHDGVGFLGDAERRAVSEPKLSSTTRPSGIGKKTAGLGDPEGSDDHRAVVELVHRFRNEQRDQQLARDRGVDHGTLVHATNSSRFASCSKVMIAPMRCRARSVAASTTSSMTLDSCERAKLPNQARLPTRWRPRRMSLWKHHHDQEDDAGDQGARIVSTVTSWSFSATI
jgi:hypothetical protein